MNAIARHEETSVVPANPAPMGAMFERVLMDPKVPMDRLEKLLEMKYQDDDRQREHLRQDREYEAKTSYFAAMSACQKELPVVVKNRRNSHTNSNYADLAAIEEQAMPVIYAHGFGVSFQPDGYNELGELLIKWEISHAGGYVRNGVGAIPVDGAGAKGGVNKTGTQAFGSTATYGRRYLLCMLFNISTGDDRDGNAPKDTGGPISEDQVNELREKIESVEADIERFCSRWNVEALKDFPKASFKDAMISLDRFASQKKQREAEGQNNG